MPDPVDLAVNNYSRNVMLIRIENESHQLALVIEALERLEDDEYGFCQNCEEEVNPKRLNAVPWQIENARNLMKEVYGRRLVCIKVNG